MRSQRNNGFKVTFAETHKFLRKKIFSRDNYMNLMPGNCFYQTHLRKLCFLGAERFEALKISIMV